MKKRKSYSLRTKSRPPTEKLCWPGLKAKDHLTRVITRAVKEAKETRENEVWAENQIARVLNYVPPESALRMVFREMRRRRKSMLPLTEALLNVLEAHERVRSSS